MQSPAAGGLWKGNQLQGIQCFFDEHAGNGRVTELSGTRIEVEAHPIRLWKCCCSAPKHAYRDAAKIRQGNLRPKRSAHDIVCRLSCSGRVRDPFCGSSRRHALRFLLLIETFAAHAAWTAFECQNPIVDIGPECGKHITIEIYEIELGIAFLGPKHLVRIGYLAWKRF